MYKLKKRVITEEITEIDVNLLDYIGNRITSLREERNLNQESLSKKLGISRSSLCNIENGRHKVNITNLESLCIIFNCKSNDILPF